MMSRRGSYKSFVMIVMPICFSKSECVETEGESYSVSPKKDAEEISFLMKTSPTRNMRAARASQQEQMRNTYGIFEKSTCAQIHNEEHIWNNVFERISVCRWRVPNKSCIWGFYG